MYAYKIGWNSLGAEAHIQSDVNKVQMTKKQLSNVNILLGSAFGIINNVLKGIKQVNCETDKIH